MHNTEVHMLFDGMAVDCSQSIDLSGTRMKLQACVQEKTIVKSNKGKFLLYEILVLTPVMLAILGLFSIPTVLYALSATEVIC